MSGSGSGSGQTVGRIGEDGIVKKLTGFPRSCVFKIYIYIFFSLFYFKINFLFKKRKEIEDFFPWALWRIKEREKKKKVTPRVHLSSFHHRGVSSNASTYRHTYHHLGGSSNHVPPRLSLTYCIRTHTHTHKQPQIHIMATSLVQCLVAASWLLAGNTYAVFLDEQHFAAAAVAPIETGSPALMPRAYYAAPAHPLQRRDDVCKQGSHPCIFISPPPRFEMYMCIYILTTTQATRLVHQGKMLAARITHSTFSSSKP